MTLFMLGFIFGALCGAVSLGIGATKQYSKGYTDVMLKRDEIKKETP